MGSIAIVHETLSQAVEEHVDFDEIADRLGRMVTDVAVVGAAVRVVRRGSFGVLASETATPLAMVITEALQNAVEHGYPDPASGATRGPSSSRPGRRAGGSSVTITDDGRGLPDGLRPRPRRRAWASRSSGPWWSPSSEGPSRWGRRRGRRDPGADRRCRL